MDRVTPVMELQEKYLKERSRVSLEELFREIEDLTGGIYWEIISGRGLGFSPEMREDIIHDVILVLLERYTRPDYRVEVSFYPVIRNCLIKRIFGEKAKKESQLMNFTPHEMTEYMDSEGIAYIDSPNVMEVLEKEIHDLPDPEVRGHVEMILDRGTPWEKYLYKIERKHVREKVQRFMLQLKKRVDEEGVDSAPKHMQLPRL